MPVDERADAPQLVLSGEIDVAVADDLRAAGSRVAAGLEPGGRLDIDMGAVSFIDSSGFGALVAVHHAAASRGLPAALVNLTPEVHRLVELSGIGELFLLP